MLLFDSIEEYTGNISEHDPDDVTVGVLRGQVLQRTPVLITTQTRRAAQITENVLLNKIYIKIRIERYGMYNNVHHLYALM